MFNLSAGLASVPPASMQKGSTTAAATAMATPSQTVEPDSGRVVLGYDTPCHRAVIRTYKATMYRTEQALAAAVAQLKQQLMQWLGQERHWIPAWIRMFDKLDEV